MMSDRGISDEQLLERFVKRKDRTALAALAQRHERALLGLAGGLLGGRRELACDAVQETWLRVIRYGLSFNGRSSFKTWLYRIVVNQCRNLHAARPPEPPTAEAAETVPLAAPGPERNAEAVDQRQALRAAVASLTPEQREIVLLCYHEHATHAQAAEILDIPVGTLKSRLHAALRELRGRLSRETDA